MKMRTIKEEFKNIARNKMLLITVLASCLIPFLYTFFFLKSVWDPYGETQNLPIAVVNQDQATTYNKKKLNLGKSLTKQLKKNTAMKWEFVSASKAKTGLKHQKYYMIITIPKNFSKSVTTVLNH